VIKTVIFDLGKVLVPFDFKRGYQGLEKVSRIPAAEIPKRIGATDLVKRFETGLVEPKDFVEQLSGILDLHISYELFCEIWSSIFLPDPLIPEGMLEGIAKRYGLLLLSNTNEIHFHMLEQTYPLFRHFHDRILSCRVRAMKPSPVIYREAIARAGCRAEECFYTDDIADFVDAARREGMDAVQFESCTQIQGELKARGVEWD
jgi:putative hydrolase of the HAD superfamily